MKIKTLTCHNVYNYGASLQAYALMKYLEKLGHHVEIIDYRPEYLNKRYKLFEVSPRFTSSFLAKCLYLSIKIPIRLFTHSRKYAFDRFSKRYLKITKRKYNSLADLMENPPKADVFFVGSDQIWNTLYQNGRDPAFYLSFAPVDSIKASYAASFATNAVVEEYESFVKSSIEKLDHISVREATGIEILSSLGIHHGSHVLDPVFLFSKDEWIEMAQEGVNESYVLVYDFENNDLIKKVARAIASKKNIRIYSINDWFKTPYADVNVKNAGPGMFLSLIANAETILSNSFHGTAFSILFEKDFYVFSRMGDKVNSRMVDLLRSLDVSERLISTFDDFHSNCIDYSLVQDKLNPLIEKSKLYIDRVLNEA